MTLTKAQANILAALKQAYRTKPIPAWVLECYDGRSLHGLLAKGLIKTLVDGDGGVRYKLNQE